MPVDLSTATMREIIDSVLAGHRSGVDVLPDRLLWLVHGCDGILRNESLAAKDAEIEALRARLDRITEAVLDDDGDF